MRFRNLTYVAAAAFAAGLASVAPQTAKAGVVTLTFDEYLDTEQILNGYDGGQGSAGDSGPDVGVVFSPSAQASESYLYGNPAGEGDFSGNPSLPNALAFVGGPDTMTVAGGFTGYLSFSYASESDLVSGYYGPSYGASVDIYGAGDTLLASTTLPDNYDSADDALDTFTEITLPFSGVADEVVFNGVTDPFGGTTTYFDNVSFVPEPASLSLFLVGLGALGVMRRRRIA